MNNSPGWASPGSAPSDEPDRGTPEQPAQPSAADDRPGAGEQPAPPNWSSNQPPAGQWTAPAGVPGQAGPGGTAPGTGDRARASAGTGHGGWAPPPGPGGPQGAWGGGWAAIPPAAKPGVIPLRPLGVGEILDGAVATMRAHWRTVLGISLIVAFVSQATATLVTGLWLPGPTRTPALDDAGGPPLRRALSDMSDSLAGSVLTTVIGLLATIVATGMLTMVISRSVLGRPVTAGDAWRDARGRLPRLLGLLLLLPLIFFAIFAVALTPGVVVSTNGPAGAGLLLVLLGLLAGGVVSIWLGVRFSLASPALMLEKQGVLASMRRSAKLVRGSWWRVLGVQLLAYLLTVIVQFIVQIPATFIAFLVGGESLMDWANGTSDASGWPFLIILGIGAVISSAITFPISAGVTALLYVDQRIRREALDLELARAAGLPAYGTEAPTGTPAPRTAPDAALATPAAPQATDAPSGPPAPRQAEPTAPQEAAPQPTTVQLTKTQPEQPEMSSQEPEEAAKASDGKPANPAPDGSQPTPDAEPGAPGTAADDSTGIPGPRPTDPAPGS
ncbi:hypothetical protein ADL22_05915 [Streptomyces sp. NRRL F-4489]|uniref:DUF7544 domain-containing protein n=1 Tax=Streptomyces sp. NRRL F-4489 TaxID=1609095 RepID=UPI00074B2A44|nr:hypothetical protein [Streptomyces sp. NRRL F-4489]KUL51678.1 hypothetical protein ADL22_05915 [Streptomyces sp. NRRL F-4489]